MELLENAAAAGGQLLRVETQWGGPSGDEIAGLRLTFDVGCLWLRADPDSGSLVGQYLAPGEAGSPDWLNSDEEDPWWRVMGSPLSRALDIGSGSGVVGVALQFRSDDANPRRIAVLARGAHLLVQLQQSAS